MQQTADVPHRRTDRLRAESPAFPITRCHIVFDCTCLSKFLIAPSIFSSPCVLWDTHHLRLCIPHEPDVLHASCWPHLLFHRYDHTQLLEECLYLVESVSEFFARLCPLEESRLCKTDTSSLNHSLIWSANHVVSLVNTYDKRFSQKGKTVETSISSPYLALKYLLAAGSMATCW